MPKQKSNEVMMDEAKAIFLMRAGELWGEWSERIQEVIENSEGKKINLSFKASMDFSESVASVDTTISFSETVTDSRHNDIDPPEQLQVPGTDRVSLMEDPEASDEEGPGAKFVRQSEEPTKPKKPRKKKEAAED